MAKENEKRATTPSFWINNKNLRWSAIAAAMLLIASIYIGLRTSSTPPFTGRINIDCRYPTLVKPWYIRSFRPKWFGIFGGPGPLTYRTKGKKAHQISVVDLDKRDISIRMRIDDKDLGFEAVVPNESVDCGADVGRCKVLGFAATKIVVPPGKHVVKAEIADTDGTFQWGQKRERRVMWMVEQCSWSSS